MTDPYEKCGHRGYNAAVCDMPRHDGPVHVDGLYGENWECGIEDPNHEGPHVPPAKMRFAREHYLAKHIARLSNAVRSLNRKIDESTPGTDNHGDSPFVGHRACVAERDRLARELEAVSGVNKRQFEDVMRERQRADAAEKRAELALEAMKAWKKWGSMSTRECSSSEFRVALERAIHAEDAALAAPASPAKRPPSISDEAHRARMPPHPAVLLDPKDPASPAPATNIIRVKCGYCQGLDPTCSKCDGRGYFAADLGTYRDENLDTHKDDK